MSLPTLTFNQWLNLFFTQFSTVANVPANTNPGSTVYAFGSGAALMAMNLQNQLQYVLAVARLGTSVSTVPGVNSPAVDSFCNVFGVKRILGVPSSGGVTFTLQSVATAQVVIPVGGIVTTASGLAFTVTADITNASYSAALNGYPINAGSTSVTATVTCTVPGTAGNVQPTQINSVANSTTSPPIPGNPNISNASAYDNGQNIEVDSSYVSRFTTTMSTGVVATNNALISALLGVYPGTTPNVPGLTYSCGDGLNSSGSATGSTVSFYVNYFATGLAAPNSLVNQVQTALANVKAGGITVNAYAPTIVPVNVAMTIHIPNGQNATPVITACQQAVAAYLNQIGLSPSGSSTAVNYFSVGAIALAVANVTKIDGLVIGENSGGLPIAGTSTATNSTSLTDSTKSWTTNAYVGATVSCGSSFGIITANSATAVTITSWVGGTPAPGLSYTITSTPAGTSDLTATFGNQFVAGALTFTPAQP